MLLVEAVRPRDIDISGDLVGSFGNAEKEIVVRNIVIMSRHWGGWRPFTFAEYKQACSHRATDREESVLDALVREGVLVFEDGHYAVGNLFIGKLAKFVQR